jgi:hypothetical protein
MEHVYELINDECTLTPPSVTDKKAAWAIHKRTPNTDDFGGSRYFLLLLLMFFVYVPFKAIVNQSSLCPLTYCMAASILHA